MGVGGSRRGLACSPMHRTSCELHVTIIETILREEEERLPDWRSGSDPTCCAGVQVNDQDSANALLSAQRPSERRVSQNATVSREPRAQVKWNAWDVESWIPVNQIALFGWCTLGAVDGRYHRNGDSIGGRRSTGPSMREPVETGVRVKFYRRAREELDRD
ncbi:hypothetical protein EVAR_86613_1 [Eumeta japonica]|uniref:Uncharacterized protein n=1 Tax=Eumeta variegata TaxID=151549 RepID=A0A4C1W0I4_EUMVA|nr:hypothetical protein EVAR_86613_1 [Eumeta japonica]